MGKENISIKMAIILKEITSKTRKEERENTILIKEEYYNPNSIQILHKFQKYTWPTAQYTSENKRTALEKAQAKPPTQTAASMMVNG